VTNPDSDSRCPCPCEGIIEIIGKKWTLCIITTIKNETKIRFNEIQRALEGISPKTLSETLRELEAAGIVKREIFAEIPPRVEYSLTQAGKKLFDAIAPLMIWSSEHPRPITIQPARTKPQLG
jgi:DNA-binding HxlR family transcriptional regulator